MKKPVILIGVVILFSISLRSQSLAPSEMVRVDSFGVRSFDGPANLPFFNSPADAETIISGIMNVLGISGEFKVRQASVPNVEARIRHHQRLILYNPEFINSINQATKSKWASIFILAHEIAHHVEGHTLHNIKSRPPVELQADQFAGFTLHKMGASLEQAQLAMRFIAAEQGSKSHPGRAYRLAAIEKGWKMANP